MRDGHQRPCCGQGHTSPPARGCEPGRAVMSRWRVGGSFAGCSMFFRFLVAVERFLCPLSFRSGPLFVRVNAKLGCGVPHLGQWGAPFHRIPHSVRPQAAPKALVFLLGLIAAARQITKSEGSRLISIGTKTTVTCTFGAAGLVPSDRLNLKLCVVIASCDNYTLLGRVGAFSLPPIVFVRNACCSNRCGRASPRQS